MPRPCSKFAIGTPVLYKPKRPVFYKTSLTGQPATLTRYSRHKNGGCFIELPSGGILRVPESDIEPIQA
jgi:hypothetical protein